MREAWGSLRDSGVPPRLVRPTNDAVRRLAGPIESRDRSGTCRASIDAAYASSDLKLRHLPVVAVDTIRFELCTRRALVDALEGSIVGVRSDFVTPEWIRDRITGALDPAQLTRVDALGGRLGTAVVEEQLGTAAQTARQLGRSVRTPG